MATSLRKRKSTSKMPLDAEDMDTSVSPADSPMATDDENPAASSNGATDAVPGPMAPPTGPAPTEIAFSFDTTGSMSSCLEEVQNHLKTIINRLFMDIPALKIGIFAHGDYCDAEHFYVTKSIDFTNDVNALFHFVTNCGGTGGGDYEECYELILKKVREDLSWTPGTTKSLVMIGDAIPHPAGHGGNDDNVDWREEVDRLHGELGVRIYAVQCMVDYNKEAVPFWNEVSKRSFGKYLEMNEFATVIDLMMAICYREGGNPALFEAYEREVRAREGPRIGNELDRMFHTLRDGPLAAPTPATAKVKPIIAKGVAGKKKVTTKHITPRVIQAAAKKAQAKTRKPKAKRTMPKLNRENVTNSQFVLNDLRWCPWKLYRGKSPSGAYSEHPNLLRNDRDKPAVYEVAVQTHENCKKHVVFFGATSGFSGRNWNTRLLRTRFHSEQVRCALDQHCKIFVRRAPLPNVVKFGGEQYKGAREVARLLSSKYSYAWMTSHKLAGGIRSKGREVVKRGCVISKNITC